MDAGFCGTAEMLGDVVGLWESAAAAGHVVGMIEELPSWCA